MLSYRVPLGPFELHEPIGRGAAGEVWRGVHIATQTPVAVKVVTAEHARDALVRSAFHNEARAMARLHHPGIVHILDYGQVTADGDAASEGRLVAGSPFLAMELASGGTLPRPRTPAPWLRLRSLLLELLDALAHAHARGVIHRDIKPGNILIAGPNDGRPGLKLTDFGIARAIGVADHHSGTISGTPHYMAPEQVLDVARDQGPWTDLYALGCLAYQLASGGRMFPDARGAELLRCQVHENPPPLVAAHLPEGFQTWLDHMLAKHPGQRYQLAADAAWGLLQLDGRGPAPHDAPGSILRATSAGPAVPGRVVATLDEALLADALMEAGQDTVQMEISASSTGSSSLLIEGALQGELATLAGFVSPWEKAGEVEQGVWRGVPPVPDSWQRAEPPRPPLKLIGAGLGLWGLRTIPLVDRDDERNLVWRRLQQVTREQRARCVVLRGGPGYGKTRLVEWLCQRANELGAARVLHATHDPIAGRGDGLGPMVAAELGCLDLEFDGALERVGSFVNAHPLRRRNDEDALALVELMRGPDHGDGDEASPAGRRIHFGAPSERYGLVQRFVERLALRRPVIVWLDDVQWGPDALGFVDFLLEMQAVAPTPVLVLATVRDDELATRGLAAHALAAVLQHDTAEAIDVGPLSARYQLELVGELMQLEGDLAADVATRTAGNPLFAIQLVGDWVSRGVLTLGGTGLRLQEGERGRIPDDLHQLWWTRVSQLFASRAEAEAAWLALEVAATAGRDVHPVEWQVACAAAGCRVPENLVETMLTHRLFVPSPIGYAFAHGMLRESLTRSAEEVGRSASHHAACADMLRRLFPTMSALVAERRAEHLLQAGALDEAVAALLFAARGRIKTADYAVAHELFERREQTLRALGATTSDPRWSEGWLPRARALLSQGHLARARDLVEQARTAAETHGWPVLAALALRDEGFVRFTTGDTHGAVLAFQRAAPELERLGRPTDKADLLQGWASVLNFRHELDEAERVSQEGVALHRVTGDYQYLGKAQKALANIRQHRGDFGGADRYLHRALESFQEHGYRFDVAACFNDLGETARLCGRLDEAEQHYRRAAELYETLGSSEATTPWFNVGLVLLARGKPGLAQEVLQGQERRALAMGGNLDLVWILAGLVACAASLNEWRATGMRLDALEQQLAKTGVVDPDIPYCLEMAGRACEAEHQRQLAWRSYALALRQRTGMDDAAAVERLRGVLAKLS